MKKTSVRLFQLLLALIVLAGTASCDALRFLAGRPTSEQITRKKAEIARIEEAERQARLDSIHCAEVAKADSLAVLDSLAKENVTLLKPSDKGGLATEDYRSRYYVIVGSFVNRAYAENLAGRILEAGYKPDMITFRNGFTAVSAWNSDSLKVVYEYLHLISSEPFCPADVWVLVNE